MKNEHDRHDLGTHILNKLCEFELNTLVTFSFQIFLVFHVSHGDEKHQLLYIFIGILYRPTSFLAIPTLQ